MKRITQWLREHKGLVAPCLLFALIYMGNGTYNPYINLFYQDRGLSTGQIGVISAVGPLASLLLQTVWGGLADRAGRKGVLIFALIGSAMCAALYLLGASFLYILIVAVLFTVFNMSVLPMSDAMALDLCTKRGFNFSPIRLCGTLGFAQTAFCFGGLFRSNLSYAFPVYIAFCVLSIVAALFFPKQEKPEKAENAEAAAEKPARVSMLPLLRDPIVIFLLASNFVIYIGSACTGYVSLYATELGFDSALCGRLSAFAAISEVPTLLLIDRIMRKVPAQKIILFSCLTMALRMGLTFAAGFCGGATYIVLAMSCLMNGITYMPGYYCSAYLIHERFPQELKSTAQTLLALVSTGIARIIANLLAGYLSEPQALGMQNMFLFFGIALLIGTLLVALYARKLPRRKTV